MLNQDLLLHIILWLRVCRCTVRISICCAEHLLLHLALYKTCGLVRFRFLLRLGRLLRPLFLKDVDITHHDLIKRWFATRHLFNRLL